MFQKRHNKLNQDILTYHVSDHFMSFCIVEGKVKLVKDTPKYIEVENITPSSISNFK